MDAGTRSDHPPAGVPGPVLDAAQLQDLLDGSFEGDPRPYRVVDVTPTGAVLRLDADKVQIRPGGTVSGPTLMAVADGAAWMATLSRIGPVLLSVTSNLSIEFLRKPAPGAVLAEATLLRLGRRQSVTTVHLWSEATSTLVAHSTVTYAIPPDGGAQLP